MIEAEIDIPIDLNVSKVSFKIDFMAFVYIVICFSMYSFHNLIYSTNFKKFKIKKIRSLKQNDSSILRVYKATSSIVNDKLYMFIDIIISDFKAIRN